MCTWDSGCPGVVVRARSCFRPTPTPRSESCLSAGRAPSPHPGSERMELETFSTRRGLGTGSLNSEPRPAASWGVARVTLITLARPPPPSPRSLHRTSLPTAGGRASHQAFYPQHRSAAFGSWLLGESGPQRSVPFLPHVGKSTQTPSGLTSGHFCPHWQAGRSISGIAVARILRLERTDYWGNKTLKSVPSITKIHRWP